MARLWTIRPGISIIRVTRTVKSRKRLTLSGLSPCEISLRGRNSRTTMAMMPEIIRRIRAIVVPRAAVGIFWLKNIGVGSHAKDMPHERPACRRSRRAMPAIISALHASRPCHRETHEGQRLPSGRYARISGCSARSVLLPEFHIGILAEMFDIPFDQCGQLPGLANLDPVIHRPEEAVALRLKGAALGIDELEHQHR